jgi:hypothetical protein
LVFLLLGLGTSVDINLLYGFLCFPGEEKFRRVPFVAGKPVYEKLAPASAGLPLMTLLGWVKEEVGGDTPGTFLTLSSATLQKNGEHIKQAIAWIEAEKAANAFAQR